MPKLKIRQKKSHKTPKPTTNAEPNQGARSKATTSRASGTLPLRGAAGSAPGAALGQGWGRAPRALLAPGTNREGSAPRGEQPGPGRPGEQRGRPSGPAGPAAPGGAKSGSAQQPGKVGREQHSRAGPGPAASPGPGQRPPPAPGLPPAATLTTRLRRRRTPPAAGPGSGPALPRGSW